MSKCMSTKKNCPACNVNFSLPYTVADLKADINAVLQTNLINLSGRALGNPANIAKWSDDKLKSFFDGIVQAQQIFFTMIPLKQFARLVVAEAAQESTLDWNLGADATGKIPVDFNDHKSYGVLQCTGASVLIDMSKYGLPFGNLDPSQAQNFDLTDPKTQILCWAFYTFNCTNMGVSMAEYFNRKAWNTQGVGNVAKIYSNCLLTWLGGPRSDCRTANGANCFLDYHNRILGYWLNGNFGTQDEFESLMNTSVAGNIKFVKDS